MLSLSWCEGPQARATGEVQAKFDPNTPVESLLPVGAGYIGVLGELQKGDALQWPVPLQGPEYEKVCKKLSKLFAEAIQEIRAGTLNEIQENLKDLEESINKNIIAFSVSQYVQARRYLIRLNRGLQTLQQTNPACLPRGYPRNWPTFLKLLLRTQATRSFLATRPSTMQAT